MTALQVLPDFCPHWICQWRVWTKTWKAVLPSYFCVNALPLIGHSFTCARAVGKWRKVRVSESVRLAKIVELEGVVNLQADKIMELETAPTDLKCGKDNLHAGYPRLSEKHKVVNEKAE
jgi:hypothetical protein